jgi:hypothetical protein
MKLIELAQEITKELKVLEKDPEYNIRVKGTLKLYNPWAYSGGAWLFIRYQSWTSSSRLSKADATKYLEWLRDGNKGKHYKMEE